MRLKTRLLSFGVMAAVAAAALPAAAYASETEVATQTLVHLDIPGGPAAAGLNALATQAGLQLFYPFEAVRDRSITPVKGDFTRDEAIQQMAAAAGLRVARIDGQTVTLSDPQSSGAAGDGADAGTVAALIVTAQKKEEAIQDVPIAISAFTEKSLEEQKIEGGFDLLKAIPNVTFSKNNFTSYNFSIRGIGTKAVSATTDPGVAVSFNNIALIQNRLFEQEYFDVERVEVLRGPQGTLYGRNATAGVINVISAKPNLHEFDGWIKGEVGNYHTKRASAMVNIPLVEDKLAVRFAGALTDRQGYDYNSVTKNHVNGRDLWSGRVTVGFNPTEHIRSNLIWERFNEDDNRSRTGKQLCHRDPGKTVIGNGTSTTTHPHAGQTDAPYYTVLRPALFSQGCLPGNLYEDAAFGTPNGLALPFVFGMLNVGADCRSAPNVPDCSSLYPLGYDRNGVAQTLVQIADPYGGTMQARDLRTIASLKDPHYTARADVLEFNFDFDINDSLTLTSQTAYNKDEVYSFQDYNRFNTVPIFTNTADLSASYDCAAGDDGAVTCTGFGGPSPWAQLAPGGYFCDPQVGCSNTLVSLDISQAKAKQFTQEVRLQSSSDAPLNFSVGANYTKFDVLVDYYVMSNMITAMALMLPFYSPVDGAIDLTRCATAGIGFQIPGPVDAGAPDAVCPYVDPNPIESINGEGHNYFRSKNPYKLKSAAVFGELYWRLGDQLKVTAGLRYNDDRKTFIPVPSQVLLAPSIVAGGVVSKGYPEKAPIKQQWREWTGRLGFDWKPDLSFTDQTLIYAFYSRGYKGGGANPPTPGFATAEETAAIAIAQGFDPSLLDSYIQLGAIPVLKLTGVEYGSTFRPEFVNAFEVGTKNTLLGGALVLNAGAFLYDYKDYQVSQIRDRTAVNENFDAKIWGFEFQTTFSPSRNFQLVGNLGYLDTRIADGETSIDIMNRTQGDPRYIVVKPWVQLPSNCVVPVGVAETFFLNHQSGYWNICGGVRGLLSFRPRPPIDPATDEPYDYRNYPELNGGAGIKAQLGGNQLPNSPHWTANVGAQYGFDVLKGWRATVRGDAYWQSQSWARVYNLDPYDKLHGWYNVNLSAWLENDAGLKIEFYAKNLLDKTPITDAFLNSDDSALTTNVFTLDPRLIGLSIKKEF